MARKVWLSNIQNPYDPYNELIVTRELVGKIIGRPKATESHTVEALEAQGVVGLYAWVDDEQEQA